MKKKRIVVIGIFILLAVIAAVALFANNADWSVIPYWAETLKKEQLVAYQASRRGGTLYCQKKGNKVLLAGKAALYSIAELFVEENQG